MDKWKEAHLTPAKAEKLRYAPVIEECPVNIECKVTEVKELGSHHMFLAEVLAVQIDEQYLNEKNKFELRVSVSREENRDIRLQREKEKDEI